MPQDIIDLLEKVFKARGFSILTSSMENRYLLMTREGVKRSVGYSPLDSRITEGEAEMYLSMAENDGSDDLLFVSPGKLRPKVKRIFKDGSVAVWDRTTLSISAGEMLLGEIEVSPAAASPEVEKGGIMDLFQTDDVNPVSELREYEKELRSLDDFDEDGFSIRKVSLKDDENLEEWGGGEEISVPEPGADTKIHGGIDKAVSAENEALKHRVPDDVLLGTIETAPIEPEPIMVDLPMMPMEPLLEKPEVQPDPAPVDPWKNWVMAPERITREKALAISGSGDGTDVERGFRPHRLYWVRFGVKSRAGRKEMDKEGTYLVDLTRGEALSIPFSIADELERAKDPVILDKIPAEVKTGHIGDGQARGLLDSIIKRDPHAEDEIVHEGTMSTVYEEVKYDVLPETIHVTKTMDILFPYWVNRSDGVESWSVDAHLGRFIKEN